MKTRSIHSRARSTWLAVLLAAAVVGCGGNDPAAPALQSVSIDAAQVYATVGVPQQLAMLGQYSDGTTVILTADIAWTSSNEAVATVDAKGTVSPWTQGAARITAVHRASGLSSTVELTSRVITALRVPTGLPKASRVDTTSSFFRVSGLIPGAIYEATVSQMTDDVDVTIYSDAAMTPETALCSSERVGLKPESCLAAANAAGELWVEVDGQWTGAGADFALDVAPAQPKRLVATLTYPDALPVTGSIGVTRELYAVTGLTPGARYEIRISNLTADVDVGVFGDYFGYALQCESYANGTVDDFCTAIPDASGNLYVELDGETTPAGGDFTLSVTKK